jgi:hypothetical protein
MRARDSGRDRTELMLGLAILTEEAGETGSHAKSRAGDAHMRDWHEAGVALAGTIRGSRES